MPENITSGRNFLSKRTAILDRYVLAELTPPFFFGIAIFTILFLAAGPIFEMANLIIKYGVPVWLVAKYTLVRIPSFAAYTLPMSVLLATLVAFGRLSVDNEIIAMKAGGISFYRILVPVLIFAVLASGVSYLLNEKIGPESLYEAKVLVSSRESRGHFPSLEDIKFSSKTKGGLDRVTIAQRFDEEDGIMHSPVINDYSEDGRLIRITHAEQAIWSRHSWYLLKGETFQFDQNGAFQSRISFAKAELDLPSKPHEIGLMERSPDEMESPLLRKTIRLMEKDPLADKDQIRSLWMRYYIRGSLSFACLVFALVGAPSGIRPVRSSSQAGIATSVFVILIYYFFLAICKSLGEHGTLSALAAAWIPNLAFLGIAGIFLLGETT